MPVLDKRKIRRGMDALCLVDSDIAEAREEIGDPASRRRPAGFQTFFSTIVSQQISTEAARAIMGRIDKIFPEKNPQSLLKIEDDDLRAAGMSYRKIEYAKELATAILDGSFDPDEIGKMSTRRRDPIYYFATRVRSLERGNLPDVFAGEPRYFSG